MPLCGLALLNQGVSNPSPISTQCVDIKGRLDISRVSRVSPYLPDISHVVLCKLDHCIVDLQQVMSNCAIEWHFIVQWQSQ